ncbi:MAG TPA: MFS transporter [Candidatus Limnocylindrales bacterium]|nr:MFS transporter [Candidatus Limnocylindrales bacterium]
MIGTPDPDALRRRTVRTLVAGVALGSTGHIAAVTVATIAARDLSDTAALAGLPGASVVLGAAIGASALAWLMARRGRRAGLSAGYAIGVAGAFLAAAAVVGRSMPLLLLGTLLIGFGNASNQQSRYAAADLYPSSRRASAIGIVVWGATIGAVVGPNLVEVAGEFARSIGLPTLAGPYLVPVVFVGLAAVLSFALLRPDPFELRDASSIAGAEAAAAAPLADVLRRPAVVAAIVALIAGQFVMVLIMTMTPLHMTEHGHGLGSVGLVISAHTFGMFALSPLSGRLTDRFGCPSVIYAGTAILAASALLSAVAPPDDERVLLVALFLLGWGWNLGFVAGSAMLTGAVSLTERTRVQGLSDSLIWTTAAVASLGSGVLLAAAGYASLGIIGAALVAVPVWVLVRRRRVISPRPIAVPQPVPPGPLE